MEISSRIETVILSTWTDCLTTWLDWKNHFEMKFMRFCIDYQKIAPITEKSKIAKFALWK